MHAGVFAIGAFNRAHAQANVCQAYSGAVAVKAAVAVVMVPFTFQPNHTVPTGLSAVPPVGPAIPVTATATCAREWATAPRAMARATGSLTAPWVAISPAGTPSSSVLASLE